MGYTLNPILMGGRVKEKRDGMIKIHLYGRLGVISVPAIYFSKGLAIEPGMEVKFYFSYVQILDTLDEEKTYESGCCEFYERLLNQKSLYPSLLGGKVTIVNDTAIQLKLFHGLGSIAVPRRWVFTSVKLEPGQLGEFYFSKMEVVEKKVCIS